MDLEQCIQIIGDLYSRSIGKDLSANQLLILEGTWKGKTFAQIASESNSTCNYIQRQLAPKLWKFLSQYFHEDINKDNLRLFFNKYSEEELLNIYNVTVQNKLLIVGKLGTSKYFCGRKEYLEKINRLIKDKRILLIYGLAGIGKTAIVHKWLESEQCNEKSKWRKIVSINARTDLVDRRIGEKIIQLLDPGVSLGNNKNIDHDLKRLLNNNQLIVIIDSAEWLLSDLIQTDIVSDNMILLKSIYDGQYLSTFIFITRELLPGTTYLAREDETVEIQKIEGLNEADAKALIIKNGVKDIENENSWKWLINNYSGNPLVLKIIASHIRDYYNGVLEDFRSKNTIFIDNELDHIFRDICSRLSMNQKKILNLIASLDDMNSMTMEMLSREFSDNILQEMIDLESKCLIERIDKKSEWTLQPMIKKFVRISYVFRELENKL